MDLLYASKIMPLTNHLFNSTIIITSSQLFLNRPLISAPFSLRVREEASELKVPFLDIDKTAITDFIRPWNLRPVFRDPSFTQLDKNRAPRITIPQHFLFLQDKHQCAEFYSGASKTATIVSFAAYGLNFRMRQAMNVQNSILRLKHTAS